MSSIRLKTIIGVSLQLVLIAGFILGCGREEQSTANHDSDIDTTNRPDAEVQGATIYLYEGQIVTTKIKAELIHKFDELDSTMAYVLDINIMDSESVEASHVVSDSGVIREKSNLLLLFGNVVVVTDDGNTLETDHLRWNQKENKVETEAFVTITKDGDIITGWGMESDRRLSRIKILKQVSGSIDEEGKQIEQ